MAWRRLQCAERRVTVRCRSVPTTRSSRRPAWCNASPRSGRTPSFHERWSRAWGSTTTLGRCCSTRDRSTRLTIAAGSDPVLMRAPARRSRRNGELADEDHLIPDASCSTSTSGRCRARARKAISTPRSAIGRPCRGRVADRRPGRHEPGRHTAVGLAAEGCENFVPGLPAADSPWGSPTHVHRELAPQWAYGAGLLVPI